jgi:hypothetical protein
MTFVAIRRCLAKAFVLFKMLARGGQNGRIAVLYDGTLIGADPSDFAMDETWANLAAAIGCPPLTN